MSISMSEAPMEWIKQMKQKEVEFLEGKISAEVLIILAKSFERNSHKQYWCDEETQEAFVKLGFSDDWKNGSRISKYIKRSPEELKKIKSFTSMDIDWRSHHARKEIEDNKDQYQGKKITWIPPYTLKEEGEYTLLGVGKKAIVCLDKKGEKHFFWFNIPKYVVLNKNYKNANGHGYSLAKQFVSKYGNEEIKRKIGVNG